MSAIVLLIGALGAFAASLLLPRRWLLGRLRLVIAGVPVAAGALMTAYALGPDTYVGGGSSRWARYGEGTQRLYALAIGVMVLAAAVAVLAAVRPSARLVRAALGLASVACALGLLTVVAFSVN